MKDKYFKIKESEVLLQLEQEEDIIRIPNLNYELGDKFTVSVRPERIKIKLEPEEGDVWLQCKLKEKNIHRLKY